MLCSSTHIPRNFVALDKFVTFQRSLDASFYNSAERGAENVVAERALSASYAFSRRFSNRSTCTRCGSAYSLPRIQAVIEPPQAVIVGYFGELLYDNVI